MEIGSDRVGTSRTQNEIKMGQDSEIEWTDHTFNPWWGCTKVSPACMNCYAATLAKRRHRNPIWGSGCARRMLGEDHWKLPFNWDRAAARRSIRARVFCGSMCDLFESRPDLPEVEAARERLWKIIEATPHLDWLLLTKRPENIQEMVPWGKRWPKNVWIGCTVENQEYAERRLPHLLKHPAAVRFLSCEPLLGPVDLGQKLGAGSGKINWVIAGGESGVGSRPSDPDWFRDLRDQCIAHGVQFFFKQWGCWAPARRGVEYGQVLSMGRCRMGRSSKKASGRKLDGRLWNQFPTGGKLAKC